MKHFSLFLAYSLCYFVMKAQPYQPNWESLDKRPVPQWFKDAKFGIFIHWGVYSVPAWSPKGEYAEWYQNGLEKHDSAIISYQKRKFGDLSYYQLADQFKAELWNPDEWAKLFEESGAKYIVLTSKHHDGFCLWPSKDSDKSWGFPWNAAERGPKRDLLGDLFKAVRKTSVHAGMYYSLYEWYNPLWKADHAAFAKEHTWPQMQDLINTYKPDVLWTDGDWSETAENWQSQKFLAWLFNESPVKDRIVVNDRWGSGTRFRHGGIYTPEYQPDLDFENHYWEESRGMGYSYGYNREEDAWDYNSTQSLVLQLIDKVSRGGNFLLDIGPDAHGKIPPIMQERLLGIGNWMKINGEAIYNTVEWQRSSQWGEGNTHYKPKNKSGDLLLKLTVDPDPGYAVKEIFFTYNEKENNLYAILPRYPDNKKIRLKDISLPAGTVINFLSTGSSLSWKQIGSDVEVEMPEYNPNTIKAPYAYVLKINNYGRFTARPEVQVEYNLKNLKPTLEIKAQESAQVFYTLDGSEPSQSATLYSAPIKLSGTATVKAVAYRENALPSLVAEGVVGSYSWQKSTPLRAPAKGLHYRCYELEPRSVKDMEGLTPAKSGVTPLITANITSRKEYCGLRFDGYFKADEDALYTFYLSSDDGSCLWIDGKQLINSDGVHSNEEKAASVALRKGYHALRIDYIQYNGAKSLQLRYSKPGTEKEVVPEGWLFH